MDKKTLALIISVLLSVCLATAANVLPDDPHWFYGSVTVGGDNAPVGSVVTATIGGETRGNITVATTGLYGSAGGEKLAVTHYSTDSSDIITFSITSPTCGGMNTLTATFLAATIENKALTFSGTCTPSTSGPGGGGGGGGGTGTVVTPPKETLVTDSSVTSGVSTAVGWTNAEVYQYGIPTIKSAETTSGAINDALAYATDTKATSELQKIKTGLQSGELASIPTTTTMTVYHVMNTDTGDWTYTTEIKITATAPDNLENVEIVEVIPPSVASSLSEVVFIGTQPEILQSENGIIAKWTIGSVKKGDSIELKYFVKKRLTSMDMMTLAAGKKLAAEPKKEEKPPAPAEKPPAEKPKTPVVGIIILIAIVVIGLAAYYFFTKKKK